MPRFNLEGDDEIKQGSDYFLNLTIEDENGTAINLTSASARGQLRNSFRATDPLAAFTCTVTDAAAGKVQAKLTNVQTAALPAPLNAVYDIEVVYADGTVSRVLEGSAFISPEVTRG